MSEQKHLFTMTTSHKCGIDQLQHVEEVLTISRSDSHSPCLEIASLTYHQQVPCHDCQLVTATPYSTSYAYYIAAIHRNRMQARDHHDSAKQALLRRAIERASQLQQTLTHSLTQSLTQTRSEPKPSSSSPCSLITTTRCTHNTWQRSPPLLF
jgi:hypothetical protein